MGFLDDAKAKLTDAVDSQGDKIASGVDKAAEVIDDKTGGKYSDKIEQGTEKVKDALDGLDGNDDDIPAGSTHSGPISGPQTHDPRE